MVFGIYLKVLNDGDFLILTVGSSTVFVLCEKMFDLPKRDSVYVIGFALTE